MCGRAVPLPGVWVGGTAAVAGGLALGTGERGGELAAVLQQLKGSTTNR
jgi:hypothetical protein